MGRGGSARLAKRGLGLLVLALACPPARAAERLPAGPPILTFKHYGPEQGLESQSIEAIHQDRAGFLWVGTLDGLFRYDGRVFRRFGRDEGLPSSFAFQLVELADGTLWTNTRFGPARRDGNRFVPMPLAGLDVPTEGFFVSTIAAGCDGELLFGGRPGLFAYRGGEPELLVEELRSAVITAVLADCARQEIWAATSGEMVRLRAGAIERFQIDPSRDSPGPIHFFALSPAGELWARGPRNLLTFDRERSLWKRRFPTLPPIADYATVTFDRAGRLWVPTNVGLALISDLGGDRFELLGKSRGLASDSFAVVYEDREGSIWIGNEADGIDRWLGRGVWEAYDAASGLAHDVVWASARGGDGALFVGNQAGLDRLSADRSTWTRYGAADGLDDAVFALAVDARGTVWAASGNGSLHRVRPGSERLELVAPPSAVSGNAVASLEIDAAGRLWVGTVAALFRGDPAREPLVLERVALPGTPTDARGQPLPEFFFGLEADRRGRMWAAGEYGLALVDDDRSLRFTKRDGLRIDFTAYLTEGQDGAIWVGYRDEFGVSRVEERDGKLVVRHFGRRDGLASEHVFALATDREGRIWAGSAKGIDRFDGERWEHLGRADGMLSEDVCQNAITPDADGGVWIGTPAGLLRAGRAERPAVEPPRTVLLEAALGSGAGAVDWNGANEPLESQGRMFVARFAALTFRDESRTRFGYRLEGLDEPESETRDGEARFARLPPGRYRFGVRARVGEEPWGEPATLAFVVRPRFHETAWFPLLAIAVAAATGGLGARWRERRQLREARLRTAEIEVEVAARTRDLSELTAALDHRRKELELLTARLERESNEDPLTGLANRRRFETALAAELRRAQRGGQPVSLLLTDIDRFKRFNDENGHPAGDDCLKRVAAVLQKSAGRAGDLAARLGGEEFVAILAATDEAGARVLGEAVRSAVRELHIPYSRSTGSYVTVSVGLATWLPDGKSAIPDGRELVERADLALYRAKNAGRDRVVHDTDEV